MGRVHLLPAWYLSSRHGMKLKFMLEIPLVKWRCHWAGQVTVLCLRDQKHIFFPTSVKVKNNITNKLFESWKFTLEIFKVTASLEREKRGVVLESQIFGMLSLIKLQYVPLAYAKKPLKAVVLSYKGS